MGSVGTPKSMTQEQRIDAIGRHLISADGGSISYEISDEEIYIDDIHVEESKRSQGLGSKMLDKVKQISENTNLPIQLMASPTEGEMTTKQLVEWYQKRGFRVSRSYGSMGSRMIYNPRRK